MIEICHYVSCISVESNALQVKNGINNYDREATVNESDMSLNSDTVSQLF